MGGVNEGPREGGGASDDVVRVRLARESCFIDSWKLEKGKDIQWQQHDSVF